MAEAEYEQECLRAELFGLPKPNKEEFLKEWQTKIEEKTETEEEEVVTTTEQEEDSGARKEGFGRIGGGLDELNSILSRTQKKLNRFKSVCGSFSNLLKLQIGVKKENEEADGETNAETNESENQVEAEKEKEGTPQLTVKKEGNTELDKLDSLINKAERAEISLSSQNKQMKKFLN